MFIYTLTYPKASRLGLLVQGVRQKMQLHVEMSPPVILKPYWIFNFDLLWELLRQAPADRDSWRGSPILCWNFKLLAKNSKMHRELLFLENSCQVTDRQEDRKWCISAHHAINTLDFPRKDHVIAGWKCETFHPLTDILELQFTTVCCTHF